ncbi:hypothetical protein D6810_00325 [Candidatus Dojkabacteria bacterium]|uniref:Uncharacterized protein n=1 Tax=Candidatus Dojkabacteria bacterium TaxID=2099670 RepID=A0A3M0Z3X8_9BACT|nr:MAG: hypothetical protein D6810_00325 [Candidatus Dojkabacteria bacterium]
MDKYNIYQRLIVIVNVVIFVIGNTILFFSAIRELPQAQIAEGIRTFGNTIKVLPDGFSKSESKNLQTNFDVINEILDGIVYEQNGDHFFVLAAPAKFRINSKGVFELISGSMIFYPNKDINISLARDAFTLKSESLTYIDSQTKSAYVYKGRVEAETKIAVEGQELYWNFDTYSTRPFIRTSVSEKKSFKILETSLSKLGISLPEIFDVTSPTISSINIANNSVVTFDELEIIGETEEKTLVTFRDKQIKTEDGKFSFKVKLSDGDNLIKIMLTDQYNQSTNYSFKIKKATESSVTIPVSMPIQ